MRRFFCSGTKLDTIIMSDQPLEIKENHILHYSDEKIIQNNFHNFDHLFEYIGKPSAWDKTIYHLCTQELEYDYFYLIEDDVFSSDFTIFINFFAEMEKIEADLTAYQLKKAEETGLGHILKRYPSYETDIPLWTFNPLCRLSKRLVIEIKKYHDKNHLIYFHEIMLPTLCMQKNFKIVTYQDHPTLSKFFGYFHYDVKSTLPKIKENIVHPVKNFV